MRFECTGGIGSIGVGEGMMIVSPDKSLFFVATALMCSASLYGAELSSPRIDPMTRVFVGEPNRLTLPPGFPVAEASVGEPATCNPAPIEPGFAVQAVKVSANGCSAGTAESAAEVLARPNSISAASAKTEISAQPISLGSAPQVH
jgi:hypothetical protein